MITTKREQQLPPSDRPAVGALRVLTAQQLDELWAAYAANRADLQLRNRLVEHYTPLIRNLAVRIARRMRLRDQENAVGEVLIALVTTIVPDYDGYSDFDCWARVCVRRRMIDQLREEQMTMSIFPEEPCGPGRPFVAESVPDRERPGYELEFLELTADLTDEQAIVLWLRHYRGMPVKAVAALLKVSPCSVKTWTHTAMLELRTHQRTLRRQ
ncbi:MAG: RNA polymerase sigma factor [Thermoguttaceae bacterium]